MRPAIVAFVMVLSLPGVCAADRGRLDLNGTWEFRLDPQEQGEAQAWHSTGVAFTRRIDVPGAWQAQGVGEPKGTLRHDYAGAAWYRRIVPVPRAWQRQVRAASHRRGTPLHHLVRERPESGRAPRDSARHSRSTSPTPSGRATTT